MISQEDGFCSSLSQTQSGAVGRKIVTLDPHLVHNEKLVGLDPRNNPTEQRPVKYELRDTMRKNLYLQLHFCLFINYVKTIYIKNNNNDLDLILSSRGRVDV